MREPERFETFFWHHWPKKLARKRAFAAWTKITPDDEPACQIQKAVRERIIWPEYQEEHRQYMAWPATRLNEERWEDEPPKQAVRRSVVEAVAEARRRDEEQRQASLRREHAA